MVTAQAGGALFEKQEADRRLELLILEEAARKDAADDARERRDKQKVKDQAHTTAAYEPPRGRPRRRVSYADSPRSRVDAAAATWTFRRAAAAATWTFRGAAATPDADVRSRPARFRRYNRKLVEQKREREKAAQAHEATFAKRFVRDSEDFLRDEKAKFDRMRVAKIKHQEELAVHAELCRKRNQSVEMDDRERQMNRVLLQKVRGDKAMLAKLEDRLTASQKLKAAKRSGA